MILRAGIAVYKREMVSEKQIRVLRNCGATVQKCSGCNTYMNRNALVTSSKLRRQSFGDGWFLSIDHDVRLTEDAVRGLLLAAQNAGARVMSAAYRRRAAPGQIHAGMWRPDTPGLIGAWYTDDARGVKPCDWSGGGCLLIHNSVFERLDYPYFRPRVVQFGTDEAEVTSGDQGFFMALREAGIQAYVWCDTVLEHGA